MAEAVDHPAQPGLAGVDAGRLVLEIGAGAQRDSVQRTQRHDQRAAVAKADHFAGNFLVVSDSYAALAAQADGPHGARHFHRQALDPGHPAEAGQGGDGFDILEQRAHQNPQNPEIFAAPDAAILTPRI